MKHVILSLLTLFMLNTTFAQVVFCPPGAKWNNSFFGSFAWVHFSDSILYTGDTIDGLQTYKVLNSKNFFKDLDACERTYRTLIKQKGDTVFMSNNRTQHTWQILYNFAATAGDSWHTSFLNAQNPPVPVTYTITVDSVGSVVYNGFNLKRLFVKYKGEGQFGVAAESAVITERIGVEGFLFNYATKWCSSDPGGFMQLLCYSDNSFGLKQFSEKPCNYRMVASGIHETTLSEIPMRVYPNPAKDQLQVEWDGSGAAELSLSDISGRVLKRMSLQSGEKVDLRDLNSGVYLVILSRNKKQLYTTKLIKVD